jgi:hypothetical protein
LSQGFVQINAQLTLTNGALVGTLEPLSVTILSLANGTPPAGVDCSIARLDANSDGIVSPSDAVYVINRAGTDDTSADMNHDAVIDNRDLAQVLAKIGTTLQ